MTDRDTRWMIEELEEKAGIAWAEALDMARKIAATPSTPAGLRDYSMYVVVETLQRYMKARHYTHYPREECAKIMDQITDGWHRGNEREPTVMLCAAWWNSATDDEREQMLDIATDMGTLDDLRITENCGKAMARYHEYINNYLYTRATYHSTTERANQLTDAAMALCGHPRYKIDSAALWTQAEREYLMEFIAWMY